MFWNGKVCRSAERMLECPGIASAVFVHLEVWACFEQGPASMAYVSAAIPKLPAEVLQQEENYD